MIDGFKNFIMRGNVIDLAVAVVLGTAFAKVVQALVDGFISPLIAALFGSPSLGNAMSFEVNGAVFSIGTILDAVIGFLLVALAVYLVIVVPMNKLAERRKAGIEPEPEAPAEDILLLQEIRDLLANRPSV